MRLDTNSAAYRWHAGSLNNGLFFGATYHLVTRLPRGTSYSIGYAGTWLAYQMMRQGTDAVIENLRVVRPDATPQELKRLALLTYRSYARDTIDFIRSLAMSRTDLEPMITSLDVRHLVESRALGRGVLLLGGHFGNWELGAVALRLLHDCPVTVVAKAEASPVVGAIRLRMRQSLGIETVEIGHMLETALRVRRLLAANSVVAMLLDRHLGRDRIDVTFFGRRTWFLRSPAMIGYLSGAPLVPAFVVRQLDHRFAAAMGEPIVVDSTKLVEDAVRAATQAFALQLETYIRANPQLWYQFYPYWRDTDSAQPT